MQALAERTGAFFVRHATVPHQMAFTNKFGTEQCAAPLLRQHKNAQSVPEERPPLWWAAAEVETAEAASTPGPAPSFAVNEAAYISTWAPSWAQQEEGSKCALLSYPPGNDYVFHVAPASGRCSRREDPFAEAGGLLWLKLVFKLMICAFGPASLVGKSKPRR